MAANPGDLRDTPMRPPRLKRRTLIVLVAFATLVAGGIDYWRRAARYRALAKNEAEYESALRAVAVTGRRTVGLLLGSAKSHRERLRSLSQKTTADNADLAENEVAFERRSLNSVEKESLPFVKSLIAESERKAILHSRRRAAYLRAARYPWLSPPVDSPDPN